MWYTTYYFYWSLKTNVEMPIFTDYFYFLVFVRGLNKEELELYTDMKVGFFFADTTTDGRYLVSTVEKLRCFFPTQRSYSQVYWYKVLTILTEIIISTEFSWVKCDNNTSLYFLGGGGINNTIDVQVKIMVS